MKQKYEHIQLLRALACIGVFITHLAPRLGATGKAAWLANQGAAGVYLFFVLSGYLVCCDRKLPTAGKKELLTYYKKRLVRILPLYYGVILYNILLHGLILKDIPADPQGLYWLRYFFLTNSVIPAPNDFWGNLSATWTISLFMAFYLLVPVFVRLIRGCTSAFFCYVLALACLRQQVQFWPLAGRRRIRLFGGRGALACYCLQAAAFGSAGKESAVGFRTLCCGRIGIRMRFIWCMP